MQLLLFLKVLDHHQWSADWPPLLLFMTELSHINPDIKHKKFYVRFTVSLVCVNEVFSFQSQAEKLTLELLFIKKPSRV